MFRAKYWGSNKNYTTKSKRGDNHKKVVRISSAWIVLWYFHLFLTVTTDWRSFLRMKFLSDRWLKTSRKRLNSRDDTMWIINNRLMFSEGERWWVDHMWTQNTCTPTGYVRSEVRSCKRVHDQQKEPMLNTNYKDHPDGQGIYLAIHLQSALINDGWSLINLHWSYYMISIISDYCVKLCVRTNLNSPRFVEIIARSRGPDLELIVSRL